MKMNKIISLILTIVMLVSCCAIFASCDWFGTKDDTEEITLWVSEKEGVAELTQTQIDRFIENNPQYAGKYTFKISGVSEADAASQVLNDVASAPDIYCFAQDQLARLVQASALLQPNDANTATIKSSNDANSVSAASVAGTVYAYPMTSDNGYYLYYDKSVITDPGTLEGIIADCLAAEKAGTTNHLFRYALENAWYTASFFFATGCTSNWYMDQDGKYTSVEDNFNSDAGFAAMKGMQKLASTSIYDSNADIFTNAAAIVTGIWNAGAAEDHFGENLGACKLPTFEVDGTTYQLSSYSGNKLMGVKPSTDSEKNLFCSALALYLTNEECQLERFESQQWGPSNLKAQQNDAVKSNISLVALAAQNEHAVPQGNIHGSWWDIAKVLGADAKEVGATDQDLRDALKEYEDAINALFGMSEDELLAWSVIGDMSNDGWKTDYAMTKVSDTVWESVVITFTAGQNYKLRQGKAWDVQIGADYVVQGGNPANIVCEVTGEYKVRLTWDGTVGSTATVEFIAAN